MSFGLPPVRPKAEISENKIIDGLYGIPDKMIYGLDDCRAKVDVVHPLEMSERNFAANQDRMEMTMLRNTQGLHAPLRFTMERRAAKAVGRLPFLPSSNLQHEILTGDIERLEFPDILNTMEYRECMGAPHIVMEHKLGIL